ncbi:MAG: hypothetical protein AAFX94_07060 [Myxococcota bacterium]
MDIAFAFGERFDSVTRPFIDAAGRNLAMWIDHHPHPAWSTFENDPRFVLVDKRAAPACPQLVTRERAGVLRTDGVDTVLAHGDFDGCIAAVKVALLGEEPYPGADEDARAVDAPGRGFSLSERGHRMSLAFAHASHAESMSDYVDLLGRAAKSLIDHEAPGQESGGLAETLDAFAAEERSLVASVMPRLADAYHPHPTLIVLELSVPLARSVKKALLQQLEERARVALIDEDGFVTAASFHDLNTPLNTLPGLHGGESYAWGHTELSEVIEAWVASVEGGA